MTHILSAPHNFLHDATDWKAGLWAGAIAGVVVLLLEMVLVWLVQGQSPWVPMHRVSAMVLGSEALLVSDGWSGFDLRIVLVALMVQVPLSIALGMGAAWLMYRFDWAGGLLVGVGFGLALYLINFHLLAPAMFPWFEAAQTWILVVSHLVYGVTLTVIYMSLRKPKIPNTYLT